MAERRLSHLWRAAGVRVKTTAVSVLVVGTVLILGMLALAAQTRGRLEDSISTATRTRALDVATIAAAGALEGDVVTLSTNQLIQVVVEGRVVSSSPGLEGVAPIADPVVAAGATVELEVAEAVFDAVERQSRFIEDESPYLVVATGFAGGGRSGVVIVASSLASAEAAVNALRPLLWIGYPITLAVVGITVWILTGMALAPVDAMRRRAEAVSAAALSSRLPVPESRDEIRRLADTLNGMLDRLEAASLRQRRFVADASHELKTPLAAMRTMLEVAGRDPDFSDWTGLLGSLRREGARMEQLVADLLTLARFDEGGLAQREEDVDLDQIIGRVAERTQHSFPEVAVDTSGIGPARVHGDAAALERLVWNLGSNAARYGGGTVRFACEASSDRVIVLVADDGPGIPPAERERVFERFVRLDEARDRQGGGTGLGLAVARAIARSHGGDVRLLETPGTTVEVRLPRGDA